MRSTRLLLSLAIVFFFLTCKKETTISPDNQAHNSFFDSAVLFLKTKLSPEDFDKLDLASDNILRYGNKNIGIQVFEKGLSNDRFLLLKNNPGTYNGNWVDLSGLSSKQANYQSGYISLESLNRQLTTKLVVDSSQVIKIIESGATVPGSVTITPMDYIGNKLSGTNRTSKIELNAMLDEVVVVCYSCAPANDYSSLFWLFGGDYSDAGLYIPGEGGGSSSAGGGTGTVGNINNVAALPAFISPDKPITDLKTELKCFTNDNSATYTISVNVNQPIPNTRDVYDPSAEFPVGHTFMTFTQNNPNGTKIIRNVGFYPKDYAKPGHDVDKSTFGDDSNTPFDASLQFTVNCTEFSTVMNALISQQGYNYDTNNFNCTNSPIEALKSININLPDTKSASVLFTGNDPADLGEDIKTLNLDNFSSANGNRQVIRTVSNINNQAASSRQGGC